MSSYSNAEKAALSMDVDACEAQLLEAAVNVWGKYEANQC